MRGTEWMWFGWDWVIGGGVEWVFGDVTWVMWWAGRMATRGGIGDLRAGEGREGVEMGVAGFWCDSEGIT